MSAIQKPKIGQTTKEFTEAIYEQLTIAMQTEPSARLHLILEFKLPGEGPAEYCYFPATNGVPIVLMLQGPQNPNMGNKPDPSLLPGKKTAIMLLNEKLEADSGPLGEWGVRLLFNKKSRSLMIYAVHLDHISEFLAKEAHLAPKQKEFAPQAEVQKEQIHMVKTLTYTEWKALKSGSLAQDKTVEQETEDQETQAAIAAVQAQEDEWIEQKSKKAKKQRI